MVYAEFYHKSAVSDELIPGCGDRSVLILDGRNRLETMHHFAKDFARKHGWLAYTINRGDSIIRSKPVTKVMPVE